MVPSIAVAATRFLDIRKSGCWQLITYTSLIGGSVVMYGQKEDNRFGPNPKLAIDNKDVA
ncbi:hypothetical protein JCM21738_5354 [Mesobacillus boroniphilus JCM 21738]|uniref:Uncharacterized protein n=2 Tax=Mesobacillus boroniphilus TaxID=308892 RepID=W4RVD8_9BACI|nr:hypothetical protein JCM21738_5354 [Mesobacillus boroniphilus JCM 21738]